jgi:alpha-L-fucosidase
MNRREFVAASAAAVGAAACIPPSAVVEPSRPRPTRQQLWWQRAEMGLFVHFGMNTFTDREWGDGHEDPRTFDPAALDARQWARAARAGGFRYAILTAKHHDGFCLWPSRHTEHSVKNSPWRGGHGDVVREFVDAMRAEGLKPGVYLSPWDRHEASYGSGDRYNDYYIAQLTELLTQYGPMCELFFDGANGEGPNGKKQAYDWPRIHATVRRLQPGALMFSDAGPDIRWIGNERGTAGDPNWCTVDPSLVPYAGFDAPEVSEWLQHGQRNGTVWRPGEADVSIRPGWFHHAGENERVRSVDNLMQLYFQSVGRNANLLLNVPPTREGRFHDTDATRLAEFGAARARFFANDRARGARVRRTAGSVEVELRTPASIRALALREMVEYGQRVVRHRVEARANGRWSPIFQGTTIGNMRFEDVTRSDSARDVQLEWPGVDAVRVVVEESDGAPALGVPGIF